MSVRYPTRHLSTPYRHLSGKYHIFTRHVSYLIICPPDIYSTRCPPDIYHNTRHPPYICHIKNWSRDRGTLKFFPSISCLLTLFRTANYTLNTGQKVIFVPLIIKKGGRNMESEEKKFNVPLSLYQFLVICMVYVWCICGTCLTDAWWELTDVWWDI